MTVLKGRKTVVSIVLLLGLAGAVGVNATVSQSIAEITEGTSLSLSDGSPHGENRQ